MTDVITPNNPSAQKKNIKRIFFGFVLIFLAVSSLAVAMYWPEFQKQFFLEMTAPAQKNVPEPVSAPATETVREQKGPVKKEGFLWVDAASSSPLRPRGSLWEGPNGQREPIGQYIATLGKTHGVRKGEKLNVYNGTDLLGQVVVDRALETVSYVVTEKSVDISKDAYYRVVAE